MSFRTKHTEVRNLRICIDIVEISNTRLCSWC